MGCWLSTCAFSRLAIHWGEPIRFLPLVQNHWKIEPLTGHADNPPPVLLDGGSACYAGDWWTPFCYPIRGVYNDYGSIEKVPTKTARDKAELAQFVQSIQKQAIPLSLGENSCHDVPVTADMDLNKILDAFHEGRLYVRYASSRGGYITVPLAQAIIKESVWRSMLDLDFSNGDYSWRPAPTLAKLRAKHKTALDCHLAWDQYYAAKPDDPKRVALHELASKLRDEGGIGFTDRAPAFDHGSARSPLDLDGVTYDKTRLLDAAAELDLVFIAAESLRITFHPTTGSGSQSDNLELWKQLNKRWIKDEVALQRKREREWA